MLLNRLVQPAGRAINVIQNVIVAVTIVSALLELVSVPSPPLREVKIHIDVCAAFAFELMNE